jgi:hypothetical protein
LIDIAAGIAQAVRGFDIFYRAAIAIHEARPDARFLVIGDKATTVIGRSLQMPSRGPSARARHRRDLMLP